MSNELATVSNRSTNVALATTVSPWREAVNDEVGANFGMFLRRTATATRRRDVGQNPVLTST
jgi:hypothetical protein